MTAETAEKYFEKTGKIYGVSEKYSFGKWTGCIYEFDNLIEAKKWLITEQYDFRERELVSLTEAKKRGYEIRKYS